jgi:hypothetical protein
VSEDDLLQKNIRRTTAQHALKQIRTLVDAERAEDAFKARALRWLIRYGWLVILAAALVSARMIGVM